MRLKFQKIIREITVTERQTDREYAIIINISINDHNTKILFPQRKKHEQSNKETLTKICNTCI